MKTLTTIPFSKPYFSIEEFEALRAPIESGWVSQGKEVEKFEKILSEICGVEHTVAVNSCTSALHLSLLAYNIGSGDEVLCPSYSFIATANSIKHASAIPIFVDVDINSSNMTPELTKQFITNKTKAIMIVHQFGFPVNLEGFRKLADKYKLLLIQDSACALGSTYQDKPLSTFGDISCLSFHPRKIITTGEGGAILTNDLKIAKKLRELRSHGASISDLERHKAQGVLYEEYNLIGYNYRMSDLHAAIGNVQLKKLEEIILKRTEIANKYISKLGMYKKEIALSTVLPKTKTNYQTFQIRILGGKQKRDALISSLVKSEISCRRGIPPAHLEKAYAKEPAYKAISLPNTELLANQGLCLPIFPELDNKSQDYIIQKIIETIEKNTM